jgi:hypothetical protein
MTLILKFPADADLRASVPSDVQDGFGIGCRLVQRHRSDTNKWHLVNGSPAPDAAELGVVIERYTKEHEERLKQYAEVNAHFVLAIATQGADGPFYG